MIKTVKIEEQNLHISWTTNKKLLENYKEGSNWPLGSASLGLKQHINFSEGILQIFGIPIIQKLAT